MNIIAFVLVIAALVIGVIVIVRARSEIGVALVCLSVALLIQFATDFSRSVHF